MSKRATGSRKDTDGDFDIESAEKIRDRLRDEYGKRLRCSTELLQATDTSSHDSNSRVSEDFAVSKFGKGLPHDNDTGMPNADAYDSRLSGLVSGGKATRTSRRRTTVPQETRYPVR